MFYSTWYPKYLLKWVLPILIINGLIFQGTASAEVTVCDSGCDYTKIQDAIDVASNDEHVHIGKGIFFENLTIIDKNLKLIGSGSSRTVIDGRLERGSPVIDIQCTSNKNIIIKGVTITGGYLDVRGFGGGGIANSDCTVTLNKSVVMGNTASGAAGIRNSSGIFKVKNSSITNNSAIRTGGGGIDNQGTLKVIDSAITNNHARSGGGGIDSSGNIFMTNSKVANNSARLGGGVVINDNATIIDSMIFNNSASERGAGILNFGALVLKKSVVISNKAGTLGGGIYTMGDLTLKHTIVSRNSAGTTGGGLYDEGTVTATGATFINNDPNNCAGISSICP